MQLNSTCRLYSWSNAYSFRQVRPSRDLDLTAWSAITFVDLSDEFSTRQIIYVTNTQTTEPTDLLSSFNTYNRPATCPWSDGYVPAVPHLHVCNLVCDRVYDWISRFQISEIRSSLTLHSVRTVIDVYVFRPDEWRSEDVSSPVSLLLLLRVDVV